MPKVCKPTNPVAINVPTSCDKGVSGEEVSQQVPTIEDGMERQVESASCQLEGIMEKHEGGEGTYPWCGGSCPT